jgi:tetratricopeptide (TPR) repeat protein
MSNAAISAAELVKIADTALKDQQLNEAARLYSRALNLEPQHTHALYHIGTLFLTGNKPEEALPALMTAWQLAPSNPACAIAFAKCILDLGEPSRAHSFLSSLPDQMQSVPQIRSALEQLAPHRDYTNTYARFATRLPQGKLEAMLASAVKHIQAREPEAALKTAWSVLWADPKGVSVWQIVNSAAESLDRRDLAELSARRAIALAPKDATSWRNLLTIHLKRRRLNDLTEMAHSVAERTQWDRQIAAPIYSAYTFGDKLEDGLEFFNQFVAEQEAPLLEVMRFRANLLQMTGRTAEARAQLDEVVARAPNDRGSIGVMASFLNRTNEPEETLDFIESARQRGVQCDRRDILDSEASALLNLRRYDEARKAATAAAAAPELPGVAPHNAHFTLADSLDKCGDFEAAYAAVKTANSSYEQHVADTRTRVVYTDTLDIIEGMNYQLDIEAEQREAFHPLSPDPDHPRLVFLVGFPRSGTTLLDTILRSHSRVEVCEEQPFLTDAIRDVRFGPLDREQGDIRFQVKEIFDDHLPNLRESYIKNLKDFVGSDASDYDLIIDKMPLNMYWAPMLHAMFPDSLFILAIRNPLDSAVSNLFQNYNPNGAMMNMTRLSRIDRLYHETFSVWERFVELRQPNVVRVTYEDVVEDLENTVGKIMDRLDLTWEDQQARFFETARRRERIKTPSATQVTQKLYTSSRERWRNYAFAFQDEDTARLREWAAKHGYNVEAE